MVIICSPRFGYTKQIHQLTAARQGALELWHELGREIGKWLAHAPIPPFTFRIDVAKYTDDAFTAGWP